MLHLRRLCIDRSIGHHGLEPVGLSWQMRVRLRGAGYEILRRRKFKSLNALSYPLRVAQRGKVYQFARARLADSEKTVKITRSSALQRFVRRGSAW
jgi:hypothetical protein